MISNQILQTTIEGLKKIARIDLCILDTDGKVLAATYQVSDEFSGTVQTFVESPAESQEMNGYQFFKVKDENQLEYILIAKGTSDDVYMVGKMATFQVQNLLVAYKERFDKDNFIKNLLLDNLLLVDIYGRAKKLHLQINAKRIVFIAETASARDVAAVDMVKDCLGLTGSKDIVTAVDENSVIIVEELEEGAGDKEIRKTALSVVNYLEKEGLSDVRVAFGTIVDEIKDVSRSYKEAKVALDVGRIFQEEKTVISYDELGIGRLIYQLPMPLCRMFIEEIFGDRNPEDFDEETITTINKFFENSLNVSETSRQLFIHRNTLVYRLDKLQKSTNLDLRVFEDAITFKIALMVVKYMKFMEARDF